jgi:hypothetical protein
MHWGKSTDEIVKDLCALALKKDAIRIMWRSEQLGTRIRSESDRCWAGHVGRLVDWCRPVHLRLGLPIKDAPWQDDALVHMAVWERWSQLTHVVRRPTSSIRFRQIELLSLRFWRGIQFSPNKWISVCRTHYWYRYSFLSPFLPDDCWFPMVSTILDGIHIDLPTSFLL